MLLALDTSTSVASLALALPATTESDARLVAELTWQVGQRHSVELLERIEWLLASSRFTMADLTGIAVALGPGSFNGVRVALATAKSLAFARGLPLYGIPTLDVIAWGHSASGGTVCALLEAGRGQVYAACYDATKADAATWTPRDGYTVLTAGDLAAQIQGSVFCCGEMSSATRATLAAALGVRARFAPPTDTRRAGWLAELALARADHQRYDDPIALEPLYLRRPAITTSARRGMTAHESANDTRQRDDAPEGEGTSDALRR
jgi:tRNA threonylcarbamoyladenosine biosynthesis protein TsaB